MSLVCPEEMEPAQAEKAGSPVEDKVPVAKATNLPAPNKVAKAEKATAKEGDREVVKAAGADRVRATAQAEDAVKIVNFNCETRARRNLTCLD